MTIADFAHEGGVGVETVRYYQRRSLLRIPESPPGEGHQARGTRRYGEDDLRRLRFIRSAQAAGFTLDQILHLLGFDPTDDRKRARELALVRVEALDAKIAELKSARDSLFELARECGMSGRAPCPILTAFEK